MLCKGMCLPALYCVDVNIIMPQHVLSQHSQSGEFLLSFMPSQATFN